ncbi:DUF6707 family protein [Kitasatospora cinereorecta]|uniref:DUF6707 family protein n=1 Tax=Kitasatospora cinereorecta TaxID=285560 RepID=A0ABW0VCC8_9ACTN
MTGDTSHLRTARRDDPARLLPYLDPAAEGLAEPSVADLLRLRRLVADRPDRAARRSAAAALHGHLGRAVTARAGALAAEPGLPPALRTAARAVTRVRPRSAKELRAVDRLAYACEAAGRVEEAQRVASALLGVPFDGDFELWSPVEGALALLWLHAGPADRPGLRAVLDVDTRIPLVVDAALARRLDGDLLREERIEALLATGEHRDAAVWAAADVRELTVMLAFGGSALWPPTRIAGRRAERLAQVRDLG